MSSYLSEDFVNQLTLNCLISKSQLMKINNSKIRKNLDEERNKKIKKYRKDLIELFENLLNGCENNGDLKKAFNHFVDESMLHLDKLYDLKECEADEKKQNSQEKDKEDKEEKQQDDEESDYENEDEDVNNILTSMIDQCYQKRYKEINFEEKMCDEDYDEDKDSNEDEDDDEENEDGYEDDEDEEY